MSAEVTVTRAGFKGGVPGEDQAVCFTRVVSAAFSTASRSAM